VKVNSLEANKCGVFSVTLKFQNSIPVFRGFLLPYCGSCGNKLEENAHFCSKCGTPAATFTPSAPLTAMKPIRNDPMFIVSMVVIAIVIFSIIIGAIIFLMFHVNFGQNTTNQQNINTLFLYGIFHK
jgi:uncharacterized membrane protein YvbJ